MSKSTKTVITVSYTCNGCREVMEKTYMPGQDEPRPAHWMHVETTEYELYDNSFMNRYHFCTKCKKEVNNVLRKIGAFETR